MKRIQDYSSFGECQWCKREERSGTLAGGEQETEGAGGEEGFYADNDCTL